MAQKFLLTLMSSWLVNPLGVLIAHWFGVANSPEILLVLLLVGTATPFQLLMNECLAAGIASNKATPSLFQLSAITLIQLITCVWAIQGVKAYAFDSDLTLLIVIALCINTLNSYVISVTFYRLVMTNGISQNNAALIGALPGLASIVLFTAFCFCSYFLASAKPWIAVAIACFPGIVQLIYLMRLANLPSSSQKTTQQYLPVIRNLRLFSSLAVLAILSIFSTDLRGLLANSDTRYSAILLVALNLILSFTNTLTRVSFLSHKKTNINRLLAVITIAGVVITFGAYLFKWPFMILIFFLTVQAATAWTISICRNLSVTSKKIRSPLVLQ